MKRIYYSATSHSRFLSYSKEVPPEKVVACSSFTADRIGLMRIRNKTMALTTSIRGGRIALLGGVTLGALAFLLPATAADIFWSGGTGTYNNAAAWGGVIPGLTDKAINDSGAGNAVQINVGDPDWI